MSLAYEPIKLTYEDYKLLPEDKRVELIEGNFLMTPAPNCKHQKILGQIFIDLATWAKNNKLGEVFVAPTDVVLSEHDVVQPDILFIAKEHLGIIKESCIKGVPDLVVEVLSPGNEERDTIVKRHLYSKFGIREYWIVDLKAETITILTFQKNKLEVQQTYPVDSVATSTVVTGFQLKTKALFSTEAADI